MTDEYPPWQVGALIGAVAIVGGITFISFVSDLVIVRGVVFGFVYSMGAYLSWAWYYRSQTRVRGCLAIVIGVYTPLLTAVWGIGVLGSTYLFAGGFLLGISTIDWLFGLTPPPADDAISAQ